MKSRKLALRATAVALAITAALGPDHSQAATITAASCSLTNVEAAVNAATDGDKIINPNGSCTWAGGIQTAKQIRIEARDYTPASGGTMSRSVTITNNSSGAPLLHFTTGNSFHVGVAGIRFNEGSGNGNHLRFEGSGAKVPLVNDCAFEVKERFGNAGDIAVLSWLAQGGLVWNSYFLGLGGGNDGASILIRSPRGWYTASTMGTLDTNGTVNVYFEDSTFKDIGQAPDVDSNGRLVIRHSLLDGAWAITHGFTSTWGGRHAEYYNNTFQVTTPNRNIAGRFFWIRAGTGVFTDNVVNSQFNGYGAPDQLDIGDNTSPKSYPQARQPGWGHNGSTHVSDPIYIWNQSGSGAYRWRVSNGWDSNVQLNRDIFVNSGPKPGYKKYPYPHPFRAGGNNEPAPLQSPSNLRVVQ
jgi:hypothetical protein